MTVSAASVMLAKSQQVIGTENSNDELEENNKLENSICAAGAGNNYLAYVNMMAANSDDDAMT